MTSRIIAQRGFTFRVPGEWRSGDPFEETTSIICRVQKGPFTSDLAVTKEGDRAFVIYASATATAAWPKGALQATLIRREPAFFGPEEDYVYGPESFVIEVE